MISQWFTFLANVSHNGLKARNLLRHDTSIHVMMQSLQRHGSEQDRTITDSGHCLLARFGFLFSQQVFIVSLFLTSRFQGYQAFPLCTLSLLVYDLLLNIPDMSDTSRSHWWRPQESKPSRMLATIHQHLKHRQLWVISSWCGQISIATSIGQSCPEFAENVCRASEALSVLAGHFGQVDLHLQEAGTTLVSCSFW